MKKASILELLKKYDLNSWDDLLDHVHKLPYGRISDKSQLHLVLEEQQGTCSAKHAFLKLAADALGLAGVELLLGFFMMDGKNSPALSTYFSSLEIEELPELHAFLKVNGKPIDITFPDNVKKTIPYDIIQSHRVNPEEMILTKEQLHRNFHKKWILSMTDFPYSEDELWSIREKCIEILQNAAL